jgi:hypothetical protein
MKAAREFPARALRRALAVSFATSLVPVLLLGQGGKPPVADTQVSNMPVPPVIHGLKPHEVIDRIIGHRHQLFLSDAQFADLKALSQAVREKGAVTERTGSSKPPFERTVKIDTPEQALARAFSILTPQQQHQALMLFEQEGAR